MSLAVSIIAALLVLYLTVLWGGLDGQGLLGPDSYMRVLRVHELLLGGRWYDPHFLRTNAPHGETLHWGRPLDAIMFGAAQVLTLFTDSRTAVYLVGLALGPMVALATIPVWSWGTRPFLGSGTFLLIFVLSGLMLHLFVNFAAGRADHHGFLALLFTVQLASVFRLALEPKSTLPAILLGVAGGVAVWASVISLISQFAFWCMLAVIYLRNGPARAAFIFQYTSALAATLAIGLLLERPLSMFFLVEFKRLSIVHLTIAVTAAATWGAIYLYLRSVPTNATAGRGLAVLVFGAGVPMVAALILFPKFFLGPSVDFDPDVRHLFLATISEFEPLFPSSARRFKRFIVYLSPVLIAVGFIAIDLRTRDPHRKSLHLVLLTGMAVYVPLALWSGRLVIYAQILALVPWAMALERLMKSDLSASVFRVQVQFRGVIVLALVAGPLFAHAVFGPRSEASPSRTSCNWVEMGRFLSRAGTANDGSDILFSYFIRGPELVWRTPYGVVGAPYGNSAALRDTGAIFKAKKDPEAKALVDSRGIDLIVICRNETENRFYRDGRDGSLLSRLENNLQPVWLVPVALPDTLSPLFKVFRVQASPFRAQL